MSSLPQPAVLLVSDLPAWGRVALASAAPLVEAAGFQACCLPTALLSTHGAYPGLVLEPQTRYLEAAWAHLEGLNLRFAAVVFGFAAAPDQVPVLERIARSVRQGGGLVVVDPILGDNGRRYGVVSPELVPALRSLAGLADLMTPNLTEAALLLDEDPAALPQGRSELLGWARRLGRLGARRVLLTSARLDRRDDRTGVLWWDEAGDSHGSLTHPWEGGGVPGTGDALTARVATGLLKGRGFAQAVRRAVRATLADLRRGRRAGRPPLWGLELTWPRP